MLNELKSQIILVLQYKKRNDKKIFHSYNKLITIDSESLADESFNLRIKALWIKVKNYASKDWILLDVIIKYSIKFFACA